MSTDPYPTDDELLKIQNWPADDLDGLINYLRNDNIWHPTYGFSNFDGTRWILTTGGWSGNEEIIGAMQNNDMWWMMHWQSSERGGRYIFMKMKEVIK
jgi:hypothetical protein